MASSIIHYAITCELIKRRRFKDTGRLLLGVVLPDSGSYGNSHLKISVDDGLRKTYDFDTYREMFSSLMKEDDLYLGYYLHLVQDVVYRHFMYDKYHWNPHIPGNVEKLHRDYEIGYYYVVRKYDLKNEIQIPEGFEHEPINRICTFDPDGLADRMNSYFIPVEKDDIFFFTKEMTDEYIAEAVEYCERELDNIDDPSKCIDGYKVAWNNRPQ